MDVGEEGDLHDRSRVGFRLTLPQKGTDPAQTPTHELRDAGGVPALFGCILPRTFLLTSCANPALSLSVQACYTGRFRPGGYMEKAGASVAQPVNRSPAPGRPTRGVSSAAEVVASPEFKALVKRRWSVSLVLLTLLFICYYGFILLVAGDKTFVSQMIGENTPLAIPIGVAVIIFAWLLTAIYVAWANRSYDPEVERLKNELRH
jgi:uncharacterized membrane protein (DUF485 family)